MRDMSTDAHMSTDARNGGDTSSCDVLFPEMFEGDTPPFCALYPSDPAYIVDPRYLRGSGDVLSFWPEMEETNGDVNETLYAVPVTGNCPAKLRRACISTFVGPRWTTPFADRRKTWSPPTFERVMNCSGDLLAVRSCCSNDQLAADSTNCDVQCGGNSDVPSGGNSDFTSGGNSDVPSGGNSDVPSCGNNEFRSGGNSDFPSGGSSDVASSGNGSNTTKAPPKLAPVSGILNNNTRVIRPIAFRPMVTHQMTQRHIDDHMTQCQSVPSHNNVASQYYQLPFCQRSPCPSQASPNLSTASCHMSQASSQASPYSQHRLTQHLPKRSAVSPHSSTQQSVYDPASSGQLTVTRAANRTQDEGYMSQEYQSHSDHSRNPNHIHKPHELNHSRDSNHSHNPNYSHNPIHSHNPNHSHTNRSDGQSHSSYGHNPNHSHANISHVSLQHDGYTGDYHGNGRSDSLSSSNLSGVSSSPSDSGVLELESMVREKDAVIEQLRETMVRNETAIIETYRQKQQNWTMHLRQVHAEWQRRLRTEQRRSYDTEQALLHQVSRLRQALPRDSDSSRRRVSPTKSDTGSDVWMDRVKEELCVVTGLYEKTRHELEVTQRQLELLRQESGGGQTVARTGQSSPGGVGVTAIAKCELPVASQVTELEKVLATEREQWMDEKNKVVRYQRHLQLNYVQMYRKNKMLEADVEQLTLELENRHIVDATAMAAEVDGAKLMVTNLAAPVDESSC